MDEAAIVKKIDQLKGERLQTIDQTRRESYDVTLPIRGVGYSLGQQNAASNLSNANAKKANMYDSTAPDCVDILASFIVSNIIPSNIRWFDLDVEHNPELRVPWLDKAADLIWREIHASNFDSAVFEGMIDLIIAGDFVLFTGYDDGLYFELWEGSTCYFECSKKGGMVDSLYREFTMTAAQAIKKFGADALPERIKLSTTNEPIIFVQGIYPRKEGKMGAPKENKPYASCYVLKEGSIAVEESGFEEFPLAIPRWSVIPNSPYATGPVYKCLPAIKTLNTAQKFALQNAEMAICGMWGAVDDGVLNTGSIQVGPRKVMVMAEQGNLFPLTSGGDFNITEAMISHMQDEVRRVMMVDQLKIPDQQGTTATEINYRMDILRQIVGPIFGRLQSELLQMVVRRCFGLLMREGVLPPLPPELQDIKGLAIRYVSPLARSQRNIEINAINEYESYLGMSAQMDPEVLDNYDFDEAAKIKANLKGIPAVLIRKDSKIKEIRDGRAQAQQQMQQQAMAHEQQLAQTKATKNGQV